MMFFGGFGDFRIRSQILLYFLKRKNEWLGRGASSDFGLEMELLRGASLHFVSKSSSRVEHAHILSLNRALAWSVLRCFWPAQGGRRII